MEGDEAIDVAMNDAGLCGCGEPDAAMLALREILSGIDDPARKKWRVADDVVRSHPEGVAMLVQYWLTEIGLADHGSMVPGWLTDKGKRVLAALRSVPLGSEETEDGRSETTSAASAADGGDHGEE